MTTKDQIRALIRKIIKEEVREMVASEVNAVLAEKFIATVSNKQTLSETMFSAPREVAKPKSAPQSFRAPQMSKEELKNRLLEKMGAKENPMMRMIYGDEEMISEAGSAPVRVANGIVAPIAQPQMGANGIIVDSDDEGIDIGQFYK